MKPYSRTIGIVFAAMLAVSTAALAQQTHAQYEPANAGGAGQKFLARMVGNWNFTDTFYGMRPNPHPQVTNGTCKQFMIQGNLFLESDFTFHHPNGTTTTGMGLSGFTPSDGKFTTVWLDSTRTEMSIRQSRGKFDGKTLALYAQQVDREHPGRETFAKAHLEDNDKVLIYDHYYVGPDNKPHLMFEIKMTRQ